jgi:hypothetical protein
MKLTSLISPGMLANAGKLRIEAATALSRAQLISLQSPGGKSKAAKDLKSFFDAMSGLCAPFVETTVPTVVSRVRTSSTVATVTFSEVLAGGDKSIPSASAFALTGGAAITSVRVSGATVILEGTGIAATQTLTYTKPTTGAKLVDLSGNEVATFSGALA